MNKLKVGDIVVCLDNKGQDYDLIIGKVYKVVDVDNLNDPLIVNDNGDLNFYFSRRFRLVTLLERELADV